jgi:hypothetical protein
MSLPSHYCSDIDVFQYKGKKKQKKKKPESSTEDSDDEYDNNDPNLEYLHPFISLENGLDIQTMLSNKSTEVSSTKSDLRSLVFNVNALTKSYL